MKVLAIGQNGTKEFVQDMYPDATVAQAQVKPAKNASDFDAIVSYMTLASLPFRKVKETVTDWVKAMKPGGELIIFTPSLEWAAYQILSPDRSPVLAIHLYGNQSMSSEFYSCGYTMMDLRSLMAEVGVSVTHAQTGEYMIGEYACECHIVRGRKK